MAKEAGERRLLSSWKEVAAYLGCDKRTCYRWEKALGLPVRRVDGASRSRIFAYADELDRWREERLVGGRHERPRAQAGSPLRRILLFAGIASLAVATALIFLPRLLASRTPADFRIRGPVLTVLDEEGRELWRYDTGLENLLDEAAYRARFQFRRLKPETWARLLPIIAIKDLDADGRAEVLFTAQTQDEFREGEIILFGPRGEIRWRVRAGREMRFGDDTFSDDYRIQGFVLADLDGDRKPEILLNAIHRPYFPSQLLVLDAWGRTRGEYWNSGHINDILVHDLDGNGRPEILIAGANNEYGTGFLAAFRADGVRGSSPQTSPRYIGSCLEPGGPDPYILLPRTDIGPLLAPQEGVSALEVLKNGRLSAITYHTGLDFEFDTELRPVEVLSSHRFEKLRAEALARHEVRGAADPGYFEDLKGRIRVWRRGEWANSSP